MKLKQKPWSESEFKSSANKSTSSTPKEASRTTSSVQATNSLSNVISSSETKELRHRRLKRNLIIGAIIAAAVLAFIIGLLVSPLLKCNREAANFTFLNTQSIAVSTQPSNVLSQTTGTTETTTAIASSISVETNRSTIQAESATITSAVTQPEFTLSSSSTLRIESATISEIAPTTVITTVEATTTASPTTKTTSAAGMALMIDLNMTAQYINRYVDLGHPEIACQNFHKYVCPMAHGASPLPKTSSRFTEENLIDADLDLFSLLLETAHSVRLGLLPREYDWLADIMTFYESCVAQDSHKYKYTELTQKLLGIGKKVEKLINANMTQNDFVLLFNLSGHFFPFAFFVQPVEQSTVQVRLDVFNSHIYEELVTAYEDGTINDDDFMRILKELDLVPGTPTYELELTLKMRPPSLLMKKKHIVTSLDALNSRTWWSWRLYFQELGIAPDSIANVTYVPAQIEHVLDALERIRSNGTILSMLTIYTKEMVLARLQRFLGIYSQYECRSQTEAFYAGALAAAKHWALRHDLTESIQTLEGPAMLMKHRLEDFLMVNVPQSHAHLATHAIANVTLKLGTPEQFIHDCAQAFIAYKQSNIINATSFTHTIFNLLRQDIERRRGTVTPDMAFANLMRNGAVLARSPYMSPTPDYGLSAMTVVIPDHFITKPIYDRNLSYAAQFGLMHSVIGHELVHALQWGPLLRLNMTLSQLIGANYTDFQNCINASYSRHLIVPSYNITLAANTWFNDEDVADVIGLQLTLDAYSRYNKLDVNPSQWNFTNEQVLFIFLGMSAMACETVDKDEYTILKEISDPHTIGGNRINAMLMETPQFSQAFHCQPGDRMYSDPSIACLHHLKSLL